jgi:outer membrane translocation and assembly module TamA
MRLSRRENPVLATRFGVGHNIGSFEFQQAQYLSATENLRGYRRNRFAGRSMFYNNTELRVRVGTLRTYLFPGAFGLLVFNDVGRVWMKHEKSTDWHVGNGVGLWFAPVNRIVINAMYTRSEEEKGLPLVTFGFQF